MMNDNNCYLCERTCRPDSEKYRSCNYRNRKSFSCLENRSYEIACTQLAVKFGRKHGWRFEGWVGYFDTTRHNWYEGAGGWAHYSNDLVVNMDDLRADLMMDADPNAYGEFVDDGLKEHEDAEKENREPRYVNYRNWLLGARHNPNASKPDYLEYKARQAKEEKDRLEKTKKELLEQLQKDADDLLAGSDGLF